MLHVGIYCVFRYETEVFDVPITLDALRSASRRFYSTPVTKTLREAVAKRQKTAFLCHSHKDREFVQGLQVLLLENGWNVYVDWQDSELPEEPDKITADKIRTQIHALDWFLFLATPNSTDSRWCPWEIGYADNCKPYDSILIIPTTDQSGKWYGNEYLQLYRQITRDNIGGLSAFPAGRGTGGIQIRHL